MPAARRVLTGPIDVASGTFRARARDYATDADSTTMETLRFILNNLPMTE